jgi:hypothetical protein
LGGGSLRRGGLARRSVVCLSGDGRRRERARQERSIRSVFGLVFRFFVAVKQRPAVAPAPGCGPPRASAHTDAPVHAARPTLSVVCSYAFPKVLVRLSPAVAASAAPVEDVVRQAAPHPAVVGPRRTAVGREGHGRREPGESLSGAQRDARFLCASLEPSRELGLFGVGRELVRWSACARCDEHSEGCE